MIQPLDRNLTLLCTHVAERHGERIKWVIIAFIISLLPMIALMKMVNEGSIL